MKRIISSVIATALTLSLFPAFANINAAASETVSPTVSGYVSAVSGDIEIASRTKTPKIYVDTSDYEGVVLAANDLKADIEAVTDVKSEIINSLASSGTGTGVVCGVTPKLITGTTIENGKGIIAVYKGSGALSSVQFSENYTDGVFTFEKAINPLQGETIKGMVWSNDDKQIPLTPVYGKAETNVDISEADIIIGTIGKSAAIDALVSSGKLDVSKVEGEWEAFTLQEVDGTLVIAGADKRGTMYGVYDFSEKMGVSPWEWWADVTPQHSNAIYVTLPAGGYTQGAPAVKYRGIFINQEYNLWNWSKSLAGEGETGMNAATYEKIFQLMARLGANYMWPAMHEYSPAFNNNPLNAQNADKYGIAMGGSHCEMLLRNNMGELLDFQTKWIEEHPDANLYMFKDDSLNKNVAYDYTDIDKEGNRVDNKQFIEDYWRERIKTNGKYENVYTVGMRGVHDGQWNPVVPSQYTTTKEKNQYKIDLLEEIITKQREILSEEIGKPASEIPQVFIPYKEILDLYNAEVDNPLEIPDDITIMWTNDNFGHIRQGATEAERQRNGGGGMYYHVSYHGRPSDVIWTAGTQLGLIKEEMSKAYDKGANNIWILNVGPLKPFENQMEYFIDLGRNMDKLRNTSVNDYVKDNAKRYFGFDDTKAQEYADIQCEYLQLANSRRPEFMQQGKFTLTSYGDEMQKEADKYAALLKRSTALYNSLNDDLKPAFYELQLYAIKTANDVMDNYIGADKSVLYASQSRGASVNKYIKQSLGGRAAIDTDTALYNTMLDGKWNNVINPWQTKEVGSWIIKIASAKAADTVTELPYTRLGIAAENQTDLSADMALEFSGYTKDVRFIDIFNQGTGSLDWRVTADKDWVTFNKISGTVYDDDRIYAGIDWSNAPTGNSTATITVTQYIGETAVDCKNITVKLNNTVKADLPEKTYAEANGYVSIVAEHYTNSVTSGDYEWSEQDDLGRSGTSMKFVPDTAAGISDNSAYLEYDVNFETTGTFDIDVYRMPTLNERGSVNFAVGIDNDTPTVLAGTNKYSGGTTDKWAEGILNNNETLTTKITVSEAGIHKIRLYGVDTGVIIDKMVITTGTKYASYYGAPESYNTTYNTSAAVMPEAKTAATEITGDITALFEPTLYISGLNADGGKITGVDVIKLGAAANAQITVAAYDNSGAMLDSKTVTGDFSAAQMNEKVTVPIDFEIPSGAAEIQAIAYDSTETLNALSPAYTADETVLSLMATYNGGKITVRSGLDEYKGREAICRITDDETGNEVYIRQETVSDNSFKTINTGTLNGTYTINIGVAGEGIVAEEKAYTQVNITTDNAEKTDTLYNWSFDTDQTATSGNNAPVISGNAVYDETNKAVKMTSTASAGGKLDVTFDKPVTVQQGQKITAVSKIAYGKLTGGYMDYEVKDSAGNELIKTHICAYSPSSGQSIKIGGVEQTDGSLPAGIKLTKTDNLALKNGYVTYTVTLDPDANTITMHISNKEGESECKGKFPQGSSFDLGSMGFSTTYANIERSCYVDDISVTKTTAPSYTVTFDIKDTEGNAVTHPTLTVTDKKYNTVIAPEKDGSYRLCDGLYSYKVTADGYGTVKEDIELSPATLSKVIPVRMTAGGAQEKTANITIQYCDEERNKIKDDVVLSERYTEGETFTVPAEYTKDFTVKTDDGLTNYFKYNEGRSQTSAAFAETMTLVLEFNNTAQYNYYEDFEDYAIDADKWSLGKDSSLPTLETDHTKYIKHTTGSATSGGYTTFDEIDTTEKKVHITADVKFTEPTGSSKGNSQFVISNTKPSFGSNITNGVNTERSGHIIALEYNGGTTFLVNGQTATKNFIGDWIHLEADVDFGDKSAKITLKNSESESEEFDTSIYSASFSKNIGSFYLRSAKSNATVSADNITVKITGAASPAMVSVLNGKSVYAFGDSIVYGHKIPQSSFMRLIADDYGMNLNMMAVNGATIMPDRSKNHNDILTQINNAPSGAPDFIVLDGYTNDAYGSKETDSFNSDGSHLDITTCLGEMKGKSATSFDNTTFCGAFEETLFTMKQKWPDTPIVFITIHKSGGRDMEVQTKLRELSMQMCEEWGIEVVDMFTYKNSEGNILDTTDTEQMKKYIIDGKGSHPNVTACREFYIPAIVAKLESLCGDTPSETEKPQETQQPQETEKPQETEQPIEGTVWKFDFGGEGAADGYTAVSADRSYTDNLDYGFIGIKYDDYKLAAGEYMDGFRTVKGQQIELENGTRAGDGADSDFVAVKDEQNPLRFTMEAENGGYYHVKVKLVNASESESASVSLFGERSHLLLTNKEIEPGGELTYEFNADVETYYRKALNGKYADDTLSIELTGKNAAIASMEVTKLDTNGTTLWVLGDSTGCDQSRNYPYYILNPFSGVGEALAKYLPGNIALSNQGDGGIASNDTTHWGCVKSAMKEGDYLYIEYGHNESGVDGYKSNLENYYKECQAKGVKMIVVGPIDRCQPKQFNSADGTWTTTLKGYSDKGKEFVEEKIALGNNDIAFVDLNASWIEFLNSTTAQVKAIRGTENYESDSVYYYYKYKTGGIDTTHINDAGADNAAYIFFTQAKAAVEAGKDAAAGSYEKVNADVLGGIVNGMRAETPFTITEEIVNAGKVGSNSLYPVIPTEEYTGYEAEITNAVFDDSGLLTSVTANVEHYDGLEAKDILYAVAVAELYNADGTKKGTYQSTTATKYDTTNGNGTFTLVISDANAVLPEGGTYKIWLQSFTSDNELIKGEDYRISDYFTPASLSEVYLIGDKEDIKTPDTFLYYGVKEGSDLNANNGWYLVGSSTRSAKLQSEMVEDAKIGYAELKKDSASGSWYLYRAFDNKYGTSKLTLETDLYYESGYMKFLLSNKTSEPNNSDKNKGINQRIDCFYIDNSGNLYNGNNEKLVAFPKNKWVHISYEADMDNGTQTLEIGDQTYTYSIIGFDTIIPSKVTITGLQQLNISGSSSNKMSARIRNTAVKHIVSDSLETRTLTVSSSDSTQGTVGITGEDGSTKTAEINSLATVTAQAKEGYKFAGWYEGDMLISETAETQIRLHKDVTLTAKFIPLEKITLTASADDDAHGTVYIDGVNENSKDVDQGTEVELVASSKDGYKFVSWTDGNGSELSKSATYKITVNEAITVTASFEALTNGDKVWDFTKYVGDNSVSATGTDSADYNGLEIHINKNDTITAHGLYWSQNGTSTGAGKLSNNRYIVFTPSKNGTLTLDFIGSPYDSSRKPRIYIVQGESTDVMYKDNTSASYAEMTGADKTTTLTAQLEAGKTYYIWSYCYNKTDRNFTVSNITFTAATE